MNHLSVQPEEQASHLVKVQKSYEAECQFFAVYFSMGNHIEEFVTEYGQKVEPGFECPSGRDSLVIGARTASDLEAAVDAIKNCTVPDHSYFVGGQYYDCDDGSTPEIIFNSSGQIVLDLCEKIIHPEFEPARSLYSQGRETMVEFWRRERWRFIDNDNLSDPTKIITYSGCDPCIEQAELPLYEN